MSIKRHPALQPFSREHQMVLFHAHQLIWLSNGRARYDLPTTIANFKKSWDEDIVLHFAEEERLFGAMPIAEESLKRLKDEHQALRELSAALFASDLKPLCFTFGQLLNDHVRWEERQFFPEIEAALTPEALADLAGQTKAIDDRHRICRNS